MEIYPVRYSPYVSVKQENITGSCFTSQSLLHVSRYYICLGFTLNLPYNALMNDGRNDPGGGACDRLSALAKTLF